LSYVDPLEETERAVSLATADPTARTQVLVRLADEGIPIAAMARAFKRPFDEITNLLKEARLSGKILVLPAADWPPGALNRLPTLPPLRANEVENLLGAFCALFNLTPAESRLVGALLVRADCTKDALHVAMAENGDPTSAIKTVDVVVCKVRKKLRKHGIEITTVWNRGYMITPKYKDVVRGRLRDFRAIT
jgi:hypothetical protein